MKICALAVATLVVASPVSADETFSLVGTWTGPRERLSKVDGWRAGDATLVVTEQKGRTFTGYPIGQIHPATSRRTSGEHSHQTGVL